MIGVYIGIICTIILNMIEIVHNKNFSEIKKEKTSIPATSYCYRVILHQTSGRLRRLHMNIFQITVGLKINKYI